MKTGTRSITWLRLAIGTATLIAGAILGFASPAVAGAPATEQRDYFPYTFTPETNLPGYQLVRAEGISFWQAVRFAFSYEFKMLLKKFTAPGEELAYFNDQRALQRFLRKVPAAGANSAVSLAMVGDIMWVRNQWNRFVSPEVLDYLASFDAVVGNLESPISRSSPPTILLRDHRKYNSDPMLVRAFRRPSGKSVFSALATANNHSFDCDDIGATETLDFLDGEEIPHSGTARKGQKRYTTFTKNGIKFGFYAAAWGLNNPDHLRTTPVQFNLMPGLAPDTGQPVDLTEVRQVLADMQQDGCRFKIVFLHWGYEYEYYPTPKIMQTGREIVAAGADLIVGSHPHVQHPPEVCFLNGYEKRYAGLPGAADLAALKSPTGAVFESADHRARKALILYSMGNFCTTMMTTLAHLGYVANIRVTAAADGSTDWEQPNGTLVYNRPSTSITGTQPPRKLLLLDHGLPPDRELRETGTVPEPYRSPVEFLRAHLALD